MALQPLVFEPYLRPQVWGGRNLERLFHKQLPPEGRYGESWEVSGHRFHVSRVAEGPLRGTPLTDLCRLHAEELFGNQLLEDGRFPLLIKLLDCQELLSVQVHPDDRLAQRLLGDERGKTEAWVILDVGPNGRIFAGLQEGTGREELVRCLRAGSVDQCLHSFQPRVGDCILLPAGTVHAVGSGVVLAEVQQSSDVTFRLSDWNRLSSDGRPRPLHIDEALEAIKFSAGPQFPVAPRPLAVSGAGNRAEALVRCPYFSLDRYQVSAALPLPYVGCLSIWMVIAGAVVLRAGDYCREFSAGETVLVPASVREGRWEAPGPGRTACLLGVTGET